jgi:hypothetical protein
MVMYHPAVLGRIEATAILQCENDKDLASRAAARFCPSMDGTLSSTLGRSASDQSDFLLLPNC